MLYEIFDRVTGAALGTFDAETPARAKLGFAKREGFDSVAQLELARSVVLSARKYPY
jgi:hypothetical protein